MDSSKEAPPSDRFVVVGAGIIGAACALRLQEAGHTVHLLDVAGAGRGCSYGNAGLIAIDHIAPLASPATLRALPALMLDRSSPLFLRLAGLPGMAAWLGAFVRASSRARFEHGAAALASLLGAARTAWQSLAKIADAQALFRDSGVLYVYEQAPRGVNAGDRLLHEYGVQFEEISPARVTADFLPQLAVPCARARYFPQMMSVVDPHALVTTLVTAAERMGAVHTRAQVLAIEHTNGRATQVMTSQGAIPCTGVLVCAGVDSAALIEPLGYRVPLARERGYHVELDDFGATDIRLPITFVERGFICNPMRSAIRLAGTVELGAASEPDWRRAALLTKHFRELFKPASPRELSCWSGDRPTLPDYLPMIGALPSHSNVFAATGHQHLGLTLAAITAELVRALVDGAPAALDPTPFRIDRFGHRPIDLSTHRRNP